MQPGTSEERAAKRALHRGGSDALNLYTAEGGGFLGWAYFPKGATNDGRSYIDGIVVASGSLPGGSIPRFNLGFTATHETGHWLGLYHTFQNGCAASGDRIEDTPRQRFPTSGCPAGEDSCPEPGLDPIHNYMDYSDDPCYTEFTPSRARGWQSSGSPSARAADRVGPPRRALMCATSPRRGIRFAGAARTGEHEPDGRKPQ